MIGFFGYTMALTYLSLLSACLGIISTLQGVGYPFLGTCFLVFCGICDAFDGKVAATKKTRTVQECRFGIQADSLSDLLAFGALPACIGISIFQRSFFFAKVAARFAFLGTVLFVLVCALLLFYVLAAMIRLAYFNVLEEERQQSEGGARTHYTGLPVTAAAVVFPMIVLLQYLFPKVDISAVYFLFIGITEFAFLSKIQVKKPGTHGILLFVLFGVVALSTVLLLRWCMQV